jgi:hypothetical protein
LAARSRKPAENQRFSRILKSADMPSIHGLPCGSGPQPIPCSLG